MNRVTVEWVRSNLSYDPETGALVWATPRRGRAPGAIAGNVSQSKNKGYRYVKVQKRRYKASHLAWVIVTGQWPTRTIDHRNRIRSDDRWENLREAGVGEQCRNAIRRHGISGTRGVRLMKSGRWRAEIKTDGIRTGLGSFSSKDEARAAYVAAAKKFHGDFFNEAVMEAPQ